MMSLLRLVLLAILAIVVTMAGVTWHQNLTVVDFSVTDASSLHAEGHRLVYAEV